MRLTPALCTIPALLVAGCSLMGPTLPAPNLSWSARSTPPPGEVHTAGVGDRMLLSANVSQGPGLRSTANNVLCADLSKRVLMPAGREYVQSTDTKGATLYCGKLIWENTFAGQEKTEIDECLSRGAEGRWSLYFNRESCPEPLSVESITYVAPSDSNRQQEIIYSGSSGSQVFLSYREFANDAQAATRNPDVRFDLADSAIVGLKGARLEILRADNLHIEYRVLQAFDASGSPE